MIPITKPLVGEAESEAARLRVAAEQAAGRVRGVEAELAAIVGALSEAELAAALSYQLDTPLVDLGAEASERAALLDQIRKPVEFAAAPN